MIVSSLSVAESSMSVIGKSTAANACVPDGSVNVPVRAV